jgi:acetyl esterase/lipase
MPTMDFPPIRPLVPEMEARRHLLDGAASTSDLTLEQAAAWNAPYGPPEDWDVTVEARTITGPHGSIPVRVYRASGERGGGARPGLVWCHGGGFVGGDLDMPEAVEVARGVVGRTGGVVVSVDYRLCPLPPALGGTADPGADDQSAVRFPVPHDDALAAYRWTRDSADELGIDPARLALGGASAGANLAAGVALHLRDVGEAPWQVLLAYPVVHPALPAPSDELAQAIQLTPPALRFPPELCLAMNENYLGGRIEEATPYAFAGLSDDLTGFPPTYIDNDEFDDLRCSGEAFAAQLRQAGVEVEQVTSLGVTHGHLNQVGFGPTVASLDRMATRINR